MCSGWRVSTAEGTSLDSLVRAPADDVIDLTRKVNRQVFLAALRFGAPAGTKYEFSCECGDLRCWRVVHATLDEIDIDSPLGTIRAH